MWTYGFARWLWGHRIATILVALALLGIVLGIIAVRGSYTPTLMLESQPIVLDFESLVTDDYKTRLAGPIRILESQWGTHRSGDFYQLHVVVDKEAGFVPQEIYLLSKTDSEKVRKTLPLTLNPDLECWSGISPGYGYAGPAYETEPLLTTRRPIYELLTQIQMPKGTNLETFNLMLRDEAGSRILVKGIELSGQCLSFFE